MDNNLDLGEKEVSETYQRLVQHSEGKYYNGVGDLLDLNEGNVKEDEIGDVDTDFVEAFESALT
jgi:hypothetical protein